MPVRRLIRNWLSWIIPEWEADLSAFESGSQAPGTYHVDIILDDRLLETRDIRFMAVKDANGSETLQPCRVSGS
ncbi:FimD/PapC N-terminal domain-containing protein [Enterobacter hormaechei]